jgi:hypothetical protein
MADIWVREFTGGLDVRRLAETSPGGTLIRAVNCHVNRGGEIEQRADFIKLYTAPLNSTVGLAQDRNGLIVFGHIPTGPTDLPSYMRYMQLQHPTGEALVGVPHWTLFEGRVQAIGAFADGTNYLFDDGVRVTDTNAPPNRAGSENPSALLTYQEKLFVGAGPVLFFSAISAPANFTGTGSGFIDMSTHARGADDLTALVRYQEFAAVFSRRTIQIWFLDPDPNLSRQAQVLTNTGTITAKSLVEYGDSDVFYLDQSGIRSLRARDSSNNAFTTDIGSPIDSLVTEAIGANVSGTPAVGVIEPQDGRMWMAMRDKIFVFSYFPGSQVSAWTTYEPGFEVDEMLTFQDRVYLRSGEDFYVYGSLSGPYQYSEDTRAEAWLPYLDADRPAQQKRVRGIDVACRGEWELRLATDPQNLNASDLIGRVTGTTFAHMQIPVQGHGTHLSVRAVATEPAGPNKPAILSSVVIHHNLDADEDH